MIKKSSKSIKESGININSIFIPKKSKVIGVGAQAIAFLHRKFPNKVIKTIQIDGKHDNAYQFIRLVLNHQNNPFFPKIYSAKLYKHSTDAHIDFSEFIDEKIFASGTPEGKGYTLLIVTEKLSIFPGITKDDLKRLGIENVEISKNILRITNNLERIKFRTAFESKKWRDIMINTSKDINFKKAMRLMEPLFRNYTPDMNTSNIMLRGKHWVFIDPIEK